MAPAPLQTLKAMAAACALSACAAPDPALADPAAVQLAAATEVVRSIASNPGSIVVICVGYAGDRGRPGLPSSQAPTPVVVGLNGCVEREGRLLAADGEGQGISVTVGAPEWSDDLRAEVPVLTSTGAIDLAAYTCRIRYESGTWRPEACELEAIS